MATLTGWDLPPPMYYLRHLTPERQGKIYYTKYTIDKIGELDVSTSTIREWNSPFKGVPGGSGNPADITYDADGLVWFAVENSNRIVQFDPDANTFKAYYVRPYYFPISVPQHLMFDRQGNLWYTGSIPVVEFSGVAIIGRLNPVSRLVDYWILPHDFLSLQGLWVDWKGNVWFSQHTGSSHAYGYSFGRLIPSTNVLTAWTIQWPSQPSLIQPRYPGIVTDRLARNIWLTYADGAGPQGNIKVVRFNESGRCFGYPYPMRGPWLWKILLDSTGNAWFTDRMGKITTIKKDADCGEIEVVEATGVLRPAQVMAVTASKRTAPVTSTSQPSRTRVTEMPVGCYTEFAVPFQNTTPNGIAINGNSVYFTDFLANKIGLLTP